MRGMVNRRIGEGRKGVERGEGGGEIGVKVQFIGFTRIDHPGNNNTVH